MSQQFNVSVFEGIVSNIGGETPHAKHKEGKKWVRTSSVLAIAQGSEEIEKGSTKLHSGNCPGRIDICITYLDRTFEIR